MAAEDTAGGPGRRGTTLDTRPTEISTLSLHDALPISAHAGVIASTGQAVRRQEPIGRQVAHGGGGYGGWHGRVDRGGAGERTESFGARRTRAWGTLGSPP